MSVIMKLQLAMSVIYVYYCTGVLQRIVVCLEDSLYIYAGVRSWQKILHIIHGTPLNSNGLIALTHSLLTNDVNLLAYPGHTDVGNVEIYDCVCIVSIFASLL